MKFVVSYLFIGAEEEGVQVDFVDYDDEKTCEDAYNNGEYEILKIEEYDEDAILEDDNDEIEEYDDYQDSEDEDDFDINDEGRFILFPNAETREDLEEELEHTFTRMMDN